MSSRAPPQQNAIGLHASERYKMKRGRFFGTGWPTRCRVEHSGCSCTLWAGRFTPSTHIRFSSGCMPSAFCCWEWAHGFPPLAA